MGTPRQEARSWMLMTKYGIDELAFETMMEKQNDKCAICNTYIGGFQADKNGTLVLQAHVDHDHKTNKVRGLLCSRCNLGLGCFKDNRNYLIGAIQYLDKHNETQQIVE